MKTQIYLLGLISLFCSGCKENADLVLYDDQVTYIYFNDSNFIGGKTNYVTERDYSFAVFPPDVDTLEVKIPLAIIGMPAKEDMAYTVEIDPTETTLPESAFIFGEMVFHKGNALDSLSLTFKKLPDMRSKSYSIKLELKENTHFKLGLQNTVNMKFNISNMLTEPTWWNLYIAYFGPYYSEIYQQWILTYTSESDPTPHPETNKRFYLYWGNMPLYVNDIPNDFPILFYHIQVVKKYFQDHVIYPNGDSSQNRILLP